MSERLQETKRRWAMLLDTETVKLHWHARCWRCRWEIDGTHPKARSASVEHVEATGHEITIEPVGREILYAVPPLAHYAERRLSR